MSEFYAPNAAYGQTAVLSAYADYMKPIAAVLPRGLEIEPERVFPGEVQVPVRAVMPWSPMRAAAWKPYDKAIVPLASPMLYLDKMDPLPRAGAYTLFAPHHQTGGMKLTTDWYELARLCDTLPQPVVVSLHPADEKLAGNKFRKRGHTVVTLGDYMYPRFLDNVHKLICGAKVACSTNISTHALYCVALGIPYFTVGERPGYLFRGPAADARWFVNTPEGQAVEDSLFALFGREPTDEITDAQKEAAAFHLGAANLKSPEALRADFEYVESLMSAPSLMRM